MINIYIPSHLKNIEVINQLDKILKYYNENCYKSNKTSYHKEVLDLDPVSRFIKMCLESNSTDEEEVSFDVLNYFTKLFYSVKGTCKVFEFMKKYLNLNITTITYTVRCLEINFGSNLVLSDVETFYSALVGFLNALVIFEELRTNIGTVILKIDDTVTKYLGSDLIIYKVHEIN